MSLVPFFENNPNFGKIHDQINERCIRVRNMTEITNKSTEHCLFLFIYLFIYNTSPYYKIT